MRHAILAVLCFVALCGAAEARVRLDLRYESYKVRGMTAEAVWRDIGRKGPHQAERGLYAQAEARIGFQWEVVFQQRGGICRATQATVDLEVRIRLPAWGDEKRADARLRAAWRRYAAKVRAHEDRHKDIALATAKKIDALLRGARAKGSCGALQRDLEVRVARLLAREREVQAHFDRTDPPIYLQ